MGIADRDYMRSPPPRRSRHFGQDDLGPHVIEGTFQRVDRDRPRSSAAVSAKRGSRLRWVPVGFLLLLAGWAIVCGLIGAQWQGRGEFFTPPSDQEITGPKRLSAVGGHHGAG